jgi:hypothetical protein
MKTAALDWEDAMTDQATTTKKASRNAEARRTRRQLLAGGTGALAAVLTAEALARPAPASAANGGNVVLGQDNTAMATTVIENGVDNSAQAALHGVGLGLTTGLSGMSDRGAGVRGDGAVGVSGNTSGAGIGVRGNAGGTGPGVYGSALDGQGVYGQSGATASTLVPVKNGVHGITDSPQGYGVVGEAVAGGTAVIGLGGDFGVVGSSTGVGVLGAGNEVGVRGDSGEPGGIGVHGGTFTGIGVLASGTTTALSVRGPAVFSRSGILTVPRGRSSAVKTIVPLSRASLVLAVVQEDLEGVWVRSAVPDPAGERFTVHLNKPAPTRVKVAWFIVN